MSSHFCPQATFRVSDFQDHRASKHSQEQGPAVASNPGIPASLCEKITADELLDSASAIPARRNMKNASHALIEHVADINPIEHRDSRLPRQPPPHRLLLFVHRYNLRLLRYQYVSISASTFDLMTSAI